MTDKYLGMYIELELPQSFHLTTMSSGNRYSFELEGEIPSSQTNGKNWIDTSDSAHGSKETTSSEQPNHSPSVQNSQHNSGECKIITGEQESIFQNHSSAQWAIKDKYNKKDRIIISGVDKLKIYLLGNDEKTKPLAGTNFNDFEEQSLDPNSATEEQSLDSNANETNEHLENKLHCHESNQTDEKVLRGKQPSAKREKAILTNTSVAQSPVFKNTAENCSCGDLEPQECDIQLEAGVNGKAENENFTSNTSRKPQEIAKPSKGSTMKRHNSDETYISQSHMKKMRKSKIGRNDKAGNKNFTSNTSRRPQDVAKPSKVSTMKRHNSVETYISQTERKKMRKSKIRRNATFNNWQMSIKRAIEYDRLRNFVTGYFSGKIFQSRPFILWPSMHPLLPYKERFLEDELD